MKIVNLDGYTTNPGDQSWDWMGNYGDYKVYDRTTADQVVERAKGANLLIINKTVLDRATLEALRPELEYIGLQSTGYNVVDCAAAKELGITVCNIPAYSTNAVAQLVFAFILSFTNQVAVHTQAVENGEWCRCPDFCFWKTPLMELDGKTLGIFGFGAIGHRVAQIAETFGMQVLVCTPHEKPLDGLHSTRFADADTVLANSDIITCHCPLTPNTQGMMNAAAFEKMKDGAIFINTSRGPVVDEQALANALNSGKLAGAGLDVLSTEPPTTDNPLLHAKNCRITPHIAWAAYETRARLLGILQSNIAAYLNGTPQNVVNG